MKHLFILNPAAKKVKNKEREIIAKIERFFSNYPDIIYDIYVSKWCRDAVPYIRDYITKVKSESVNETVRVHSLGGTGTLFEVVNGVVGFPNVQVAVHPYGRADTFLQYFGLDKMELFASMQEQVFCDTIPVDLIRCGNDYGVCYGKTGLEAYGSALGDKWIEKGMPADFSYVGTAVLKILSKKAVVQHYNINIDGTRLDGEYATILIANTPCYGDRMYPAIDAHPDDGKMDVYLVKNMSRMKMFTTIPIYIKGGYRKCPELISHYTAKKMSISSDEVMCMGIDGEHFYGPSMDYEIMTHALRIVRPNGIDLEKLPVIYNNPQEGLRGER